MRPTSRGNRTHACWLELRRDAGIANRRARCRRTPRLELLENRCLLTTHALHHAMLAMGTHGIAAHAVAAIRSAGESGNAIRQTASDVSTEMVPGPSDGALVPVASFGGGTLYRSTDGPFLALRLQGSYYQMGRQYGKLLGAQMQAMYRQLQLSKLYPQPWNNLQAFSERTTALYPEKLKQMMAGMATTSGLNVDQIDILNEFFTYLLHASVDPPATDPAATQEFGCSCIMAWGSYTNGAGLVMGRNFDFAPGYQAFNPYLTMVALNPTDGNTPTAILAYAGQVGAIQTFSKDGFVLENNDAHSSGDNGRYWYTRRSFLANDVTVMLHSHTFQELDQAMKANRVTYPLIYCVANPHRGFCYESATYAVKRRDGDPPGLLVATNHFIDPSWGTLPTPEENSVERYNNLMALGQRYRGSINPLVMSEILDTPIHQGGATTEYTVYQFVAYPSQLTVWVKAPGYSNWTEFRLSELFAAH